MPAERTAIAFTAERIPTPHRFILRENNTAFRNQRPPNQEWPLPHRFPPFAARENSSSMSANKILQHIVLLKFKPAAPPDQITTMIQEWKALALFIPSISSISMGWQLNLTRGQGWDYGATVTISNGEEVLSLRTLFNFLHVFPGPNAYSTRYSYFSKKPFPFNKPSFL